MLFGAASKRYGTENNLATSGLCLCHSEDDAARKLRFYLYLCSFCKTVKVRVNNVVAVFVATRPLKISLVRNATKEVMFPKRGEMSRV